MPEPVLSYIITTKNKLPYLSYTLEKLLAARRPDEEILVADAASTDGTREYLAKLLQEKKIDFLSSESDFGEPHALNKLFLKARGEIMTIVTDDDAFYYPGKKICREFMLAHPEVDMLGTNGGFKNQFLDKPVRPLVYTANFKERQTHHTPFNFCGLGVMIRRTSLPILGLWNPSFRRADAEFGMRVTAGPARLAWYTAPTFVNISTPQSVSLVYQKKIKDETHRLEKFYLNKNPDFYIVERLKVLQNKLSQGWPFAKPKTPANPAQWPQLFSAAETWLKEENKQNNGTFLF